MIFRTVSLTDDGTVIAQAEGHATDVINRFRDVAELLLTTRGPWRITEVKGTCDERTEWDSDMVWILIAKSKG
jgi:hypothetical protein